jgi:F-type H+-transporting ATPase subunit alpha
MAAFAQFASDLDESTQQVLSRWVRMVEMLKQWVNAPIPFHKQVVLIYAGIKWYLDDVEVNQILPFEAAVYNKLDTTYEALATQIKDEKKLSEDIEEGMKKIIDEAIAEVK